MVEESAGQKLVEQNYQGDLGSQGAVTSEEKKNYDKESRLPSFTQQEPGIRILNDS